jgi:hypothetical protein
MASTYKTIVSLERAAEIFRAIGLRTLDTDREVSITEAEQYIPADTFAEFLEVNRSRYLFREAGV